jgi:mono/diheme cytochrome c family protein
MRTIGLLAVILGLATASTEYQTTGARNPPLIIHSMSGHDLFDFYCATCHGRDGKGNGPVAAALKTPPPDLTTMTVRSGGSFPRAHVEEYVTHGGAVAAHGTAEMPVWGPVFRGLDVSDTLATVRIGNVVTYIESLQKRP